MDKRCLLGVGLLLSALTAIPAEAVIGTPDPVPAATLLLPYFEVDLDSPTGANTLVSIGNADAAPVIVHVTMWTDLSVPTLGWNMYLTGYDVITINLRDLFISGALPPTEHVNDGDAISPVGTFSLETDTATGVGPGSTSCNGQLPLPVLPALFLAHIRGAHTGQGTFLFNGACSGVDHGDNVARGYITFDSASSCGLEFPGDPGYFVNGGLGIANNKNALLGDFAIVNPGAGTAFGEPMVHLEADASLDSGEYTFYRRYSFGTGADNREPLGTSFWARYTDQGIFTGGTRLITWRDSKRRIFPFTCALVAPSPFPLSQNQVVIFDEQENPDVPESSPFSPPAPGTLVPFPWEAGAVTVGGADFPSPFSSGWLFLNLNNTVSGSEVPFEPALQNFVAVVQQQTAVFNIGFGAFQLDNALAFTDLYLPLCDGAPDPPACGTIPIFADGFETGDLSRWDLVFP